jgi:hypothetical protein
MAEGERVAGPDPVLLLFRHVLAERQRAVLPRGGRWLEIGTVPPGSPGPFDGAGALPGALDGRDLAALGEWLADVLPTGSPLLLAVRNRRREAGVSSPAEVKGALGAAFAWGGGSALGALLPAPGEAGWAAASPQLFGLLAAGERLVRRLPIVRDLGAFTVLEGRRR